LEEHPRIAKDITLEMVNNQNIDVVVLDDNIGITQMFEIKIGDDLPKSLNNMQLHKEMRDYSLLAAQYALRYETTPTIYLICMGIYDFEIYARLIGLMSEKWNWVRVHMPYRTDTGIQKVFEIIKKPENVEERHIPTLISNELKGFVLSIQALVPGVSVGLAAYLSQRLHLSDDLEDIEKYIKDYYEDDKKHTALAEKIYKARENTWFRDYGCEEEIE